MLLNLLTNNNMLLIMITYCYLRIDSGVDDLTALRHYREMANMTQLKLAEKLNVTPPAVTQWESGDRKPDIVTLKKIATILNCTADDLLEPIEI